MRCVHARIYQKVVRGRALEDDSDHTRLSDADARERAMTYNVVVRVTRELCSRRDCLRRCVGAGRTAGVRAGDCVRTATYRKSDQSVICADKGRKPM